MIKRASIPFDGVSVRVNQNATLTVNLMFRGVCVYYCVSPTLNVGDSYNIQNKER